MVRVHDQVTRVAASVSVLFDLVWLLNGGVEELSEKSVYKFSYYILNLLFRSLHMYFIIQYTKYSKIYSSFLINVFDEPIF